MSHVAVSAAVTPAAGAQTAGGKSAQGIQASAGGFGALFASIVQGNVQAFGRSINTSPLPTLFNVEAGPATFAEGTPLQPLTPFQGDVVAEKIPGLMARVEQVLADKPEILQQVKSTLTNLTQTQEGLAVLANPDALTKVLEVQGVPNDVANTLAKSAQFADWEEILAMPKPLPKNLQTPPLEKLEKVESAQDDESGVDEKELKQPLLHNIPYAAQKADTAEHVLRDLPLTPLPVPLVNKVMVVDGAEQVSTRVPPTLADDAGEAIMVDAAAIPSSTKGKETELARISPAPRVNQTQINKQGVPSLNASAAEAPISEDTLQNNGVDVTDVAQTVKNARTTQHTHTAPRDMVAPAVQSSAPVVAESTRFNPKNNRVVKEGEHIAAPKGDVIYTLTAKDIVPTPAANNFAQPLAQTPLVNTTATAYNADVTTEAEGEDTAQIKQDMAGIHASSAERRTGTAATTQPFTAPRTPVHQQLQMQIQQLAQQGGGNIKLQLNPEHLGEITIELDIKHGHVQGTIAASNPEVIEQLARELHILKQGFAEAGLQLTEQGVDIMWQQPDTAQNDTADTATLNSQNNEGVMAEDNSVNLAGRWIASEQIIDVEV